MLPAVFSIPGFHSKCGQPLSDLILVVPLKIPAKDFPYNFGLRLINLQCIFVQTISKRRFAGDEFLVFHSVLIAPPLVFGDALALLLRDGGEHRRQQFAAHLLGVDVLFLEENSDSSVFEDAHMLQAIDRIASESGN